MAFRPKKLTLPYNYSDKELVSSLNALFTDIYKNLGDIFLYYGDGTVVNSINGVKGDITLEGVTINGITAAGGSSGGPNSFIGLYDTASIYPSADRVVFWDDSQNIYTHATVTGGLEVSGTSLQVADGGITEAKIDAKDSPAAGEYLSYEVGGQFEWTVAPGSPNCFGTITGITADVVADSSTDTLTLASANNILTIVGTAATDTITYTIVPTNITSLGTVTAGTISTGSVLADVTMTLGADADGDVYYRTGNKLTRLAKGAATEVLTMNAGATAPEWSAGGAGDMLKAAYDGTAGFIKAAAGGTNIDTSGSTGVPYITAGTWSVDATTLAATHGGTAQTTYTTGDILYASAANTLSKLAKGASGRILTMNATIPEWAVAGTALWVDDGTKIYPASWAADTNIMCVSTTGNLAVNLDASGSVNLQNQTQDVTITFTSDATNSSGVGPHTWRIECDTDRGSPATWGGHFDIRNTNWSYNGNMNWVIERGNNSYAFDEAWFFQSGYATTDAGASRGMLRLGYPLKMAEVDDSGSLPFLPPASSLRVYGYIYPSDQNQKLYYRESTDGDSANHALYNDDDDFYVNLGVAAEVNDADSLLIYDASAVAYKKILRSTLMAGVTGGSWTDAGDYYKISTDTAAVARVYDTRGSFYTFPIVSATVTRIGFSLVKDQSTNNPYGINVNTDTFQGRRYPGSNYIPAVYSNLSASHVAHASGGAFNCAYLARTTSAFTERVTSGSAGGTRMIGFICESAATKWSFNTGGFLHHHKSEAGGTGYTGTYSPPQHLDTASYLFATLATSVGNSPIRTAMNGVEGEISIISGSGWGGTAGVSTTQNTVSLGNMRIECDNSSAPHWGCYGMSIRLNYTAGAGTSVAQWQHAYLASGKCIRGIDFTQLQQGTGFICMVDLAHTSVESSEAIKMKADDWINFYAGNTNYIIKAATATSTINITANAQTTTFSSTAMTVPDGYYIYLDGSTNTGIKNWSGSDRIDFKIAGAIKHTFAASLASFNTAVTIAGGGLTVSSGHIVQTSAYNHYFDHTAGTNYMKHYSSGGYEGIDFYVGVSSSVRMMTIHNGGFSVGGNMSPTINSDGTTGYTLGSASWYWKDIYTKNSHIGDLYMTDVKCSSCGREFSVNDEIIFTVIGKTSKEIQTVPKCLDCNNSIRKETA